MRSDEAGTFRRDLFFRLSVFPVELPPLRERREDIPLLVRQFIHLASRQARCGPPEVTDAQMARLRADSWSGNIRELQNVIERAMILSSCRLEDLRRGRRRRAARHQADDAGLAPAIPRHPQDAGGGEGMR